MATVINGIRQYKLSDPDFEEWYKQVARAAFNTDCDLNANASGGVGGPPIFLDVKISGKFADVVYTWDENYINCGKKCYMELDYEEDFGVLLIKYNGSFVPIFNHEHWGTFWSCDWLQNDIDHFFKKHPELNRHIKLNNSLCQTYIWRYESGDYREISHAVPDMGTFWGGIPENHLVFHDETTANNYMLKKIMEFQDNHRCTLEKDTCCNKFVARDMDGFEIQYWKITKEYLCYT